MTASIQLHSYYQKRDLFKEPLSFIQQKVQRLSRRLFDSRAPLPYHSSDLSLSESKPIEFKISRELVWATKHMERQPRRGWFSLSFASLAKLPCPFEIECQKETLPHLEVGVAHAQGLRPTQEDVHIACSGKFGVGKPLYYDLFGIVDGHGGDATARFVKAHLQEEIEKALLKHNVRFDMLRGESAESDRDVWRALKEAFVQLDARIAREIGSESGAAAVISLRMGSSLWTANLGDCRAVLVAGDEISQLSIDAKPDMPRFKKGIEKRGGFVATHRVTPRINGVLACARAFGDKGLKGAGGHFVVSPRPKITKVDLDAYRGRPIHFILACDGIWDVATSRDAASIAGKADPEKAAAAIVRAALNSGSTDNCSALVVRLAK
jgi:protein phosphatase PTC2/3